MKKVKSTKKLIRFCQRNGIWPFSPLPPLEDHAMRWQLMYGLIDGDVCRAEFVSRPIEGKPVYRLSWAGSPRGVREHTEMMYGGQRSQIIKIEAF
mgnify:FL=1